MLSLEQQDIIENSIWVVNSALKKQGLNYDEDLRQSAILYMCNCLTRYDPNKHIKWTTFAYKNVYLFIKRTHKKQYIKKSFEIYTEFPVEDIKRDTKELDKISLQLDDILSLCNQNEKRVLELKFAGYRHNEISAIMKCSVSKVNNYMQHIKQKAGEYKNEQQKV